MSEATWRDYNIGPDDIEPGLAETSRTVQSGATVEYARTLACSWGHPDSVWTSVNGADWQRTEVSTSEDRRAIV